MAGNLIGDSLPVTGVYDLDPYKGDGLPVIEAYMIWSDSKLAWGIF